MNETTNGRQKGFASTSPSFFGKPRRMTDQNLKILVIGSGGREHTIAKECARSPRVDQVMVTPGNGGINLEFVSFTVGVEDNQGIVKLALSYFLGILSDSIN